MQFVLGYLFLCSLVGVVGYAIGNIHHRGKAGFWWSALLGPLTWPFLLLLRDLRPRCSECKGPVQEGATRCMHCGVEFQVNESDLEVSDSLESSSLDSDDLDDLRARLAISSDEALEKIVDAGAGDFEPRVVALARQLLALRKEATQEGTSDGER